MIIEKNPFHFGKSHKAAGALMGHHQHFVIQFSNNIMVLCIVFDESYMK